MSRFLLATWPFVGCVHPFIAVGNALRERGHDVAFYTGASAEDLLRTEGFRLYPFKHVDEPKVWEVVVATETGAASMWRRPVIARRTFREWLAGTASGQVDDLEEIMASFRPDVIVAETSMWGPITVLSEASHTPVALLSSFLGCMSPGADAPPWGPGWSPPRTRWTRLAFNAIDKAAAMAGAPVRREVNAVRARYELAPLRRPINHQLGRLPLYLIPSIPELDFDRRDLPGNVRYVGPCTWNKPSGAPPPAWLGDLPPDQPVVHVTEGSLHYQQPFLLRAAVAGLAGAPLQAILTTGTHRQPDALGLGPLAPNVRVERWVSHADLLPRCSAVVTTGGAGTVLAALQAGVPLVIVPTHWDKPDNAARVVAAGAGIRLNAEACTPDTLRAAVVRVLNDPEFGFHARRIAGLLQQAPGPHGAASLLETLAGVHITSSGPVPTTLRGGQV